MSEPRFTQDGKRYRPYWWYLLWTVAIAAGISALVAIIYLMSATAPAALSCIGYGLGALVFLVLVALVPWIGQNGNE